MTVMTEAKKAKIKTPKTHAEKTGIAKTAAKPKAGRRSSDRAYKILFICPEVVRDLIVGYAPGEWRKDADFSTLTRVGASYVSEDEKERHDDLVRRVKVAGRWLWVYIMLEFQSQPDQWMALRMMGASKNLADKASPQVEKRSLLR
ncbi:MAG: Rpn family recombination-promoting nuclease/putative transposase [Acidobacteriota bacterium]|jgi:predicted transposase YdaD|nr:Rpn family recombination-promoting nuclease/putative transposase [Acidobacteriota bacterium]